MYVCVCACVHPFLSIFFFSLWFSVCLYTGAERFVREGLKGTSPVRVSLHALAHIFCLHVSEAHNSEDSRAWLSPTCYILCQPRSRRSHPARMGQALWTSPAKGFTAEFMADSLRCPICLALSRAEELAFRYRETSNADTQKESRRTRWVVVISGLPLFVCANEWPGVSPLICPEGNNLCSVSTSRWTASEATSHRSLSVGVVR